MAERRTFRRVVVVGGSLLALAIVGVALLFLAMQTPPARSAVARLVGQAIDQPDRRTATISGVSGMIPFSVQVERFELGDHDGVWLTVEGLEWRLSAAALLTGRIRFQRAAASELRLSRLPRRHPDEPARERPVSMPRLTIDEISVERLLLGAQVLGARADEVAGSPPRWVGPLRTRGAGVVGGSGPAIEARVTAAGRAANLPGGVECEAIELAVAARGRFPLAQIDADLDCGQLSAPGLERGRVRVEARAVEASELRPGAYRIELSARVDEAVVPPGLESFLGRSAQADGAIVVGRTGDADVAVSVERTRVSTAALTAEVAGAIARDGRVVLDPVDLERLDLASVPGVGLRGDASGEASLAIGGGERLRVDGVLDLAGVELGDRALGGVLGDDPRVAVEATLGDDGRVTIARAALTGADASVAADGVVSPADGALDLRVEARWPDLARVAGLERFVATGTDAELAAAVGGTFSHVTVDASVRSRAAALDLAARAAVHDGRNLEVESFVADAPGTTARARGRIDLSSLLASGSAELVSEDLAAHPVASSLGLVGRARASVRAAADGAKQALAIEVDAAGAGVNVSDGRATLDVLALRANLSDVLGDIGGNVRLEARGLDAVDVVSLELERVAIDAKAAAGGWDVDVETLGRGREPLELSGAARVVPATADRDLRIDVRRLDGRLLGETLAMESPARLTFPRTADSTFEVDGLAVTLGDAEVRGGLVVAGGVARGAIDVRRLPLELLRFVPRAPSWAGTLDGRVEARADGIGGRATFSGLRPLSREDDGDAPVGDLSFEWTSAGLDGRVSVASAAGTDLDAAVHLALPAPGTGRARPPAGGGGARVTARGMVDCAELDRLLGLTGGAVAGRLSVDIEATGSVAAPQLRGRAELVDARWESHASGAVLEHLRAELTAAGGSGVSYRLDADDGATGTVSVQGVADFAGGLDAPTFAARLRAVGARALWRDDARVRVDAELEIARGRRAADAQGERAGRPTDHAGTAVPVADGTVRGNVTVAEADIRLAPRGGGGVRELEVVEINTSYARRRRTQNGAGHGAAVLLVDVAVDAPGRVFIRSPELESEWSGNLQVGGTTAAATLDGRLSVVRGHFGTAGIRFVLQEGNVVFDGGEVIDPAVRIVGEATRDDVVGRLTISGTAARPTVELSSVPAMPPDEVMSRLLFGQTSSSLSAGQSIQLAAALSRLVRGGGGMDPIGWVRRMFGVDSVSFAGSGQEEGVAGTVVTVGKYVAPGVYVSVDQGVANQSSKARVEVDITKRVSVESEVGADSTGSLGLNWRWRY